VQQPKVEKTQSSIVPDAGDTEKRQKIWKIQEEPSFNLSEILPSKENKPNSTRTKIFREGS
jgi:hypothetical protein